MSMDIKAIRNKLSDRDGAAGVGVTVVAGLCDELEVLHDVAAEMARLLRDSIVTQQCVPEVIARGNAVKRILKRYRDIP